MNTLIPHSLHRRDFLRVLGGAGMYAALSPAVRASQNGLCTVSILHTTDLHGHILPTTTYEGVSDVGGLARCATQIRLWRRQNPNNLLIDVGDVYQGTQVGLSTQGRVMINVFNHLNYDAWVIGNHEFDWGMDAVNGALTQSGMPVLCANSTLDGKPAGTLDDPRNPLSHIAPYILKEVAGFKIGIVGVTTPGMPYWFHETFYQGIDFLDPLPSVRQALRALRAEGADAIVIAGHMGLRRGGDDFANRTRTLMAEFPEIAAFLGGHTHQDIPNQSIAGVPFTQANYFGIHAGRLDITFDRETRRPAWVQPMTSYMDERFAIDPAVLSLSEEALEQAAAIQSTPVGILGETLHIDNAVGQPSQVEELIAAAIMDSMAERDIEIDAVVHGLIFPDGDFEAGPKTIGDLWSIMPYENQIVTARLTADEIAAILKEVYTHRNKLNIMGMHADLSGHGSELEILALFDSDGRPLDGRRRYRLAFNSYDAQSGGKRYMTLREILRRPNSDRQIHSVQSREALIDYFAARDVVMPVRRFRREQAAG